MVDALGLAQTTMSFPPSGIFVTHVVPLGLSCRVTYQVRTYFRSNAAYPFDWWNTSMKGITRYLENPDPDRIFTEDGLVEQFEDGWIYSIVSRAFGFQLFHEFPRQKEARAIRVVSPNWRDHIPSARAKHQLRLHHLLDLDRPGNTILFVRHKLDTFDGGKNFQAEVEELWQTLTDRWRHAEIRLLLINVPLFALPYRYVQRLEFDDPPGPPPESWRGDEERWASAFRSLGLMPQSGIPALECLPSPGEEF
jgi:hypothetical protein